MKAAPKICNGVGIIHGGAVCTIIDMCTGILSGIFDKQKRDHLTLHLTSNFMRAIKKDETFYVLCKVDKFGEKIIYLSCQIFSEKGDLCYRGQHIKSILSQRLGPAGLEHTKL